MYVKMSTSGIRLAVLLELSRMLGSEELLLLQFLTDVIHQADKRNDGKNQPQVINITQELKPDINSNGSLTGGTHPSCTEQEQICVEAY
jgi:hypothetical protein